MILSDFINELKYFPGNSEIYISNTDGEMKSPIFKLMYFKDYNATGISTVPESLIDIQLSKNIGDKQWINPYDNFYIWDDFRNVVKWNKSKYNKIRLETIYKNTHKEFSEWYNEYVEFKNNNQDFYTVGGLIKVLRNFNKRTPVNIRTSNNLLNIYAIRQETREYIGGHPDDLRYDLINELDLICGYNTNMGMFNIEDASLNWMELENLISDYLCSVKSENVNMSIDEIARNLRKEIYTYFKLECQINGSIDCNGSIHMFDKDNPFKHYSKKV